MNLPRNGKKMAAVLLIVAGFFTAVYGASLFKQTIPPVVVESAAAMAEGCDPLKAQNTPIEGIPGSIRFSCVGVVGSAFQAAFHVSTTGTVIADFDLTATGYTSLGFVTHSAPSCSSSTALTPRVPFTLGAGDYDYCASYSATPPAGSSFGSVSIDWSTP